MPLSSQTAKKMEAFAKWVEEYEPRLFPLMDFDEDEWELWPLRSNPKGTKTEIGQSYNPEVKE
jgi:hypothetical protein